MRSIISVLAIISVFFCCVTADAAVATKKNKIHKKTKPVASQCIIKSPQYAGLIANADAAVATKKNKIHKKTKPVASQCIIKSPKYAGLIANAEAAVAAKKNKIHKKTKPVAIQCITKSPKYAGLVVNAETAEIMYSRNAKARRHPASLTKMMTIYLTFEALKAGKLQMNDVLIASKHAASQQRINLDLKPGSKINVREAIYGLVVQSANDAAVVLGEHIAGSEDAFVNKMNAKAKSLGLRDTKFCNPHGLHNDKQVTTAYDMALLALAMQKHFPQYYHMLSKTSFTYNGKLIKGHNRVLERYQWANGGKTGYIRASGYNIVTSTRSPDGKLVAVVMGGQQGKRGADRDEHTIQLLQDAYNTIKSKKTRS